jgi:hypothetical protein
LGLSRIASFSALQKLRMYTLYWAEQGRALTAIAQSCHHLVEIGREVIPAGSIVEFAQCCPSVEVLDVTLSASVTAVEVQLITEHWAGLRALLLIHAPHALSWTSQLKEALMRLVLRCATLTTLVCAEWFSKDQVGRDAHLAQLIPMVPAEGTGTVAVLPGESPLQRLWLKKLTAGNVRSIAARCPRLFEVVHQVEVSAEHVAIFASAMVKSVGFPSTGVGLDCFSHLCGLRLWSIGSNQERGIDRLCQRSPNMKSLDLHFTVRPELGYLPDILSAVPHLRHFSLYAVPPGSEHDGNVTELVRSMVLRLCPLVVLGNIAV